MKEKKHFSVFKGLSFGEKIKNGGHKPYGWHEIMLKVTVFRL